MNAFYYQEKINDVITKCPIEAGIEILVYNFLDELLDSKQYVLVDTNRLPKKQDSRLSTDAAVPDLAILPPEFIFKESRTGNAYAFVEVKAAGISLRKTNRILGEMEKTAHFLYTNGIEWKYYFQKKLQWKKNLGMVKVPYSISTITIDQDEFETLKQALQMINWKDS